MDASVQHDEFRRLTAGYMERNGHDDPHGRDWICRCHRSASEFLRSFPTNQSRRDLLASLRSVGAARRQVAGNFGRLICGQD